MSGSHDLGIKGEEIAVKHLKDSGYKIVERNWKAGKLEIDIIASKGKFIVFAEVKTRSADFVVPPAMAVNRDKQRSIIMAADIYIKRYNIDQEGRFDIITIVSSEDVYSVEHIEDAFYPTLR